MEFGTVNREKVKQDENQRAGTNEFVLRKGVNHLRVLPPHPESDLWFKKTSCHWLSRGAVPCPRQVSQPCPVCEEGERLYTSGVESNVKAALELRPKDQYYYNVVVFDVPDKKVDPKSGVMVLRTGVKIFRSFKDLDNDFAGGWGDMTNPETGFDVRITKSGEGKENTDYITKGVPNREPLTKALARFGVDLNTLTLVDLDNHVSIPSYDEVKFAFENKRVAPGFPGGPRHSVPVAELEGEEIPRPTPGDTRFNAPDISPAPDVTFTNVTLPPVVED